MESPKKRLRTIFMAMGTMKNPKRRKSQITPEIKIKMQLCIFINKYVEIVILN